MKKLLNVLHIRRIIVIIAIAAILFGAVCYRKVPARIAAYDYRICDSCLGGMPEHGLYKRKNILPAI